jgi:hypothetical protein
MAIVKEVEIKVDAKQATKSLDELGESFEDVSKEIQPLSGRIGELEDRLYEMAEAGESGTKEFKDLTAEVGKMKKVIVDTDMVVDGMSQTMAQNLGGALGGITSAFELGAGAMGAMGVESEKVEEALLKVQSAMAIAQGVQGIREAIPAFNGLKNSIVSAASGLTNFQKALIATGLGAIVAVVGALAANWDKVTEFLRGTTKQQEAYNEVANKAVEIASKELNALDKLQRTINDETVSREDKNAAVKELQEGYPDLLKNIDAEEVSLTELNKAIELNSELVMLNAQMQAIAELRAEAMKEKIQAATDAQTGQNEAWYDGLTSLFAYTNGLGDYVDEEKLAAQRTKEATKEAEDKINVYDELEKSTKEQIAAIKESIGATEDETKAVEKNTKEIDKNVEKRKEQEDIIGRFVRANQERQVEELQSDIVLTDAKISNSNRLYAAIVENLKKEAEERKLKEAEELQRAKEIESAKLELAGATLQGIGNLVNAFAGENEEQQKRAFNISKAISIAQATIDTYKGATAAFASTAASPLGIANPAAPFIAAAAAVAAGLANVATIARQQYGGGGSGGTGGGAGASNPPAGLSNPATFNVVGNTGTNQLAQTLGQQPLQAYVVAGDVTSAQSLERNKIQQSTL